LASHPPLPGAHSFSQGTCAEQQLGTVGHCAGFRGYSKHSGVGSQVWWIILHGRLRQEDLELQASLGSIAGPCLYPANESRNGKYFSSIPMLVSVFPTQ
jgi:hypothetical protein